MKCFNACKLYTVHRAIQNRSIRVCMCVCVRRERERQKCASLHWNLSINKRRKQKLARFSLLTKYQRFQILATMIYIFNFMTCYNSIVILCMNYMGFDMKSNWWMYVFEEKHWCDSHTVPMLSSHQRGNITRVIFCCAMQEYCVKTEIISVFCKSKFSLWASLMGMYQQFKKNYRMFKSSLPKW